MFAPMESRICDDWSAAARQTDYWEMRLRSQLANYRREFKRPEARAFHRQYVGRIVATLRHYRAELARF